MLSDKRIIEEYEKGSIIIDPFVKNHLNPNSYDVRLGREFYFPNEEFKKEITFLDIFTKLIHRDIGILEVFIGEKSTDSSEYNCFS